MKNIISLLKIETLQNFSFLKIKNTSNIVFSLIVAAFLVLIGLISTMYNYMFYSLGLGSLYPIFVYCICIIVTFALTFYRVKTSLFDSKDFDQLSSLPIKTSSIVIAKLLNIILFNLVITLLICIPAIVICNIKLNYDVFNLSVIYLFSSFIPCIIASLAAFLITITFKNSRWSNIVIIFINLSFVLGLMTLIFSNDPTVNPLGMYVKLVNIFIEVYPLINIVTKAIYNILYLLLYVGISLILFVLFSYIISIFYKRINNYNTFKLSKKLLDNSDFINNSKLKTLLKIELNRLLSYPIYFINIVTGSLMGIIMVIVFNIYLKDMPVELKDMVIDFYPLALAFFSGLIPTTAIGISLEGKCFSLLKSLPLKKDEIFKSKILFNILLNLPLCIISLLIMIFVAKLDIMTIIISLIIVISSIILSSFLGLLINLYLPKIDYTNLTQVVKNSASVLVTLSLNTLIYGLFSIIYFFMLKYELDNLIVFVSLFYFAALIKITCTILNKMKDKLFSQIIC